jgi:hypothetical protein
VANSEKLLLCARFLSKLVRMHISKFLAVICVSAIGSASLLAQRPDNDVQARARAQLREAMGELNGQPATNSMPAAAQPVKPVTVAPTKPMPAQPAVTPAPVVIQKPAMTTPAQPMPMAVKKPGGLSPEAEMRAREALRQAEAQVAMQTPMAGMEPPTRAMRPGSTGVFKEPTIAAPANLTVPPPQLSGSKQQRLDQLLQQYKSDQITSTQYHEQRAKVLAEP